MSSEGFGVVTPHQSPSPPSTSIYSRAEDERGGEASEGEGVQTDGLTAAPTRGLAGGLAPR